MKQAERLSSRSGRKGTFAGLCALFLCLSAGCTPTPISYPPPERTSWTPEGCRDVPSDSAILGLPAEYFRGLHADTLNSDEVAIALSPVLEFEWTAEPDFYVAEGPVFDANGNLYLSPLYPGEAVILVSLEPETGARRWAIPGTSRYGGGTPLVLEDPPNPGQQVIYLSVYDRALAARTDGTVHWDVPTGLPAPPVPDASTTINDYHCYGLNYHPQADALVGFMGDGNMVVLDRATGTPLLGAAYVIPGSPSPPKPPSSLPPEIIEKANVAIGPLVPYLPAGTNFASLLEQILLGYSAKVANYFAIDPHTGRMFVAATALDEEDGTVDGISELGALYCLELVTAGGPPYSIQELYHTNFVGGSASSPALKADGTRVYLGDNLGNLIAVDTSDGSRIWEINVGTQIYGSVSVASDNDEIYTSNAEAVTRVRDDGSSASMVWRSLLSGYTPGLGQQLFNLNLATVGANGIFVQSGAGYVAGDTSLPLKLGVGLVDRETGGMRYFADGREETVSAVSVGPDGAVYFGHSPLRRLVARAFFGDLTTPVTGGVGKYAPRRLDLLIRDAACAASARALNAFTNAGICPASAEADIRQIQALVDQSRRSAVRAIEDGDLSASEWAALDGYLTLAEGNLAPATLDVAAGYLEQVCDFF